MRWLVLSVMLASCGSKAKPKPPPAELAASAVTDIAGEWVADDDMSWSYALAIQPSGELVGTVDRGKLPPCERKGTLTPNGERKFKLVMRRNTCDQRVAGAGMAEVEISSYTGNSLTVVVTADDGVPETRTYTRRPR